MIDWIKSFFHREEPRAPALEPGTVCCAHGCCREATDQWRPSVCALNEAGIAPQWMPVCPECDVYLNNTLTAFFHQSKYDEELDAYKQRRLS